MESSTLYELLAARSGQPAPNQDPENGVRYGVIPSHAVSSWSLDDIYTHATDLNYEYAKTEMLRELEAIWTDDTEDLLESLAGFSDSHYLDFPEDLDLEHYTKLDAKNFAEAVFEDIDNSTSGDWYQSDETSYLYESDGYKILLATDGDLFVEKSPYYSLRGLCSPCAPNACYLLTDGSLKSYCLGFEWFDEDRPIPYPCYRMSDGAPAKRISALR